MNANTFFANLNKINSRNVEVELTMFILVSYVRSLSGEIVVVFPTKTEKNHISQTWIIHNSGRNLVKTKVSENSINIKMMLSQTFIRFKVR